MGLSQPGRRFGWFDGAILVAATALGLVMANHVHELYTRTWFDGGRHNPHGFRLWRYVSVPLFVSWTLALIPLQFRRPRPRLRLLARRPGSVTCLVIALLAIRAGVKQATWLLINHGQWGVSFKLIGSGRLFYFGGVLGAYPSWLIVAADETGFPLAAAWLALWLGRWWRPEASWIDRAGRALGCYWLALFVVSSYDGLAS